MRRVLIALGVVITLAGVVLCVLRIAGLEARELEVARDVRPTGARTELGRVRLEAGETTVFEACSRDGFASETWRGAARLAVRHVGDDAIVVETALDDAVLGRITREPQGACLVVASGKLDVAGEYALEVHDARAGLPELRGHIIAFREQSLAGDAWRLAILLFGVVVTLVASSRWRGSPGNEGASVASGPAKIAIGVAALVVVIVGLWFVPLAGATGAFLQAAVIAVAQVAIALVLLRREPQTLGARRPENIIGWVLLVVAPIVGVVLFVGGGILARLIPSTGVAPIETFVSWPSGNLAVAAVAVAVPIAEEIFFRGLVYGTAERAWGTAAAFAITTALFAIAHLPQQWGNWGAFASVLVTGIVLTALRSISKTVLVPAAAHVSHNALLALFAIA